MQRILPVKMTGMMKEYSLTIPTQPSKLGYGTPACSVNRWVGLLKAEMHSLKPAS